MKILMTGKTVTKDSPPRYVKNNHRTRQTLEEKGVGLLSSGSYVAPVINLKAARKLVGVKPPKHGKRLFQDIKSSLGELIRPVTMAENGRLYAVGNSVMSPEIFPDKMLQFITQSELLRRCKIEGHALRVKSRKDGKAVEGICLGSPSKPYAALVFKDRNNKLGIRDLETKRNAHNADVLVSVIDEPKDKDRVLRAIQSVGHQTLKLT